MYEMQAVFDSRRRKETQYLLSMQQIMSIKGYQISQQFANSHTIKSTTFLPRCWVKRIGWLPEDQYY